MTVFAELVHGAVLFNDYSIDSLKHRRNIVGVTFQTKIDFYDRGRAGLRREPSIVVCGSKSRKVISAYRPCTTTERRIFLSDWLFSSFDYRAVRDRDRTSDIREQSCPMKLLSYPTGLERRKFVTRSSKRDKLSICYVRDPIYTRNRETDFFKFNLEIFIVLPAVRTQLRHVFAIHRVRLELVALT